MVLSSLCKCSGVFVLLNSLYRISLTGHGKIIRFERYVRSVRINIAYCGWRMFFRKQYQGWKLKLMVSRHPLLTVSAAV